MEFFAGIYFCGIYFCGKESTKRKSAYFAEFIFADGIDVFPIICRIYFCALIVLSFCVDFIFTEDNKIQSDFWGNYY